jgi:hypothetical protein
MKRVLLLIIMIMSLSGFTQVAPDYYAIKFTDKDNNSYSLDNPEEFLTQRSMDRRTRQGIDYNITDLPITSSYVEQVANIGVSVKRRVKWINTILIKTTDADLLDQIAALPFVEGVTKVSDENNYPPIKQKNFFQVEEDLEGVEYPRVKNSKSPSSLDYGDAYDQIQLINGIPLHDAGFQGQGMVIAILDGGFIGVEQRIVFDSLWDNGQILGSRDFASEENNAFSGSSHGTKVLSTMGANWPGEMIGTAPKASYWLLRTEFTDYENIIEEYNWLVGAAFADSVGADVINSSLGYNLFDDSSQDHTWDDMDGNTTIVTIGADMAAAKGILPVNSAGNSGSNSWIYITSPADGDSVFTIGAVGFNGELADFSSRGLPDDPRVKPNVCAVGAGTTVASAYYDEITSSSGTSFSSPTIAGMTACLWQAHYNLNNKEIMELIEASASQANNPDTDYGYGIPDYEAADGLVGIEQVTEHENSITLYPNPAFDLLYLEGAKLNDKVEIYDINGRLLLSTYFQANQIDISNLDAGAYFVKVISGQKTESIGFIKQ